MTFFSGVVAVRFTRFISRIITKSINNDVKLSLIYVENGQRGLFRSKYDFQERRVKVGFDLIQ